MTTKCHVYRLQTNPWQFEEETFENRHGTHTKATATSCLHQRDNYQTRIDTRNQLGENLSSGFPIRSYSKQPVQLQRLARMMILSMKQV